MHCMISPWVYWQANKQSNDGSSKITKISELNYSADKRVCETWRMRGSWHPLLFQVLMSRPTLLAALSTFLSSV